MIDYSNHTRSREPSPAMLALRAIAEFTAICTMFATLALAALVIAV